MAKKTIVLVDGDVLAYRVAAAVEERSISVKHLPTGKTKRFKNRTELKKRLKEKFPETFSEALVEYEISDVQEAAPVSHACYSIKTRLKKLKETFDADVVEVYVDGFGNFREKLELPKLYKGQRADSIRPVHLLDVKDYLKKTHGAMSIQGIETDDVVNIRAYQELNKGNRAIIASNDKDTLQSEGVIFFDYTKENPSAFLIPEIGELHYEKTEVKGCGLKFFAFQLLFGDIVDNYSPTDICGVRYGKKSVYNDLVDLQTKEEILNKVVQKYKEWYPEPVEYQTWAGATVTKNWSEILELYFKCAYMQREWDDKTTWQDFFKERGWKDDSDTRLQAVGDNGGTPDSESTAPADGPEEAATKEKTTE